MHAKKIVGHLYRAVAVGCMLYALTLVGQTARAAEPALCEGTSFLTCHDARCALEQGH